MPRALDASLNSYRAVGMTAGSVRTIVFQRTLVYICRVNFDTNTNARTYTIGKFTYV